MIKGGTPPPTNRKAVSIMKRYDEAANYMEYGITTYEAILADIIENNDVYGIENPEEYAEEIYAAVEELSK